MADKAREWTKFGRYALLDKIGSGGMAEIFRAKTFGAAGFEKEFAMKLILPSLANDVEFVEMFINEAKIAVSLYHTNIVQVFDLGEMNQQYYIAMEYVYGKDLLDVLARCAEMGIKIPLHIVLFIVMEMLKGLDFAHFAKDIYGEDLHVIHRDVSPSNILISYVGDVKVGDFGVAKAAIQRNLTESGTLKGKVGYMSPEQVMGENVDARSDIFSACIVFFEALSMSRLFVGGSDLDVMLRVRDADVAESIKKAEPLPAALRAIIERGLTRYPEERYQTAGEFYQALVDFCFRYEIKVTGTDLSNFMRRLFSAEIEREKNIRRTEPGSSGVDSSQEFYVTPEIAPSDMFSSDPQLIVNPEAKAAASKVLKRVIEPERPALQEPVLDDTGRFEPDPAAIASSENLDYRLRDANDTIFGPMSEKSLIELLRAGMTNEPSFVSFLHGPWIDTLTWEKLRASGETEAEFVEIKLDEISADVTALEMSDTEVYGGVQAGNARLANNTSGSLRETFEDYRASVATESELGALASEKSEFDGLEPYSPVANLAPSVGPYAERGLGVETIQELKREYAIYEGDLRNVSFARILTRVHQSRATGRLYMSLEGIEKSIYFRQGEPIFVQSNKKEELLGHFLLTRNLITPTQLSGALARLNEWGGRLGDALVAIGAIPAHEVFRHLSEQMSEKLLDIFSWDSGYYGYYENQEPDTQGYALDLDTYEIIVSGCRDRINLERIKRFYANRMQVAMYLRQPPILNIDRLRLRARELRIFTQFSSGDSLKTLVARFPAELEDTVFRTVYLLHQTEIIAFEVTEKIELPDIPPYG